MRCSSYCTVRTYDLSKLRNAYAKQYQIKRLSDVLILENQHRFAFIFSYGCLVFWNWSEEEEDKFVKKIRNYSTGDPVNEQDVFEYNLGLKQSVKNDTIVLDQREPLDYQMLAVSYALSQSAKLAVFEDRIEGTIEDTKHLPVELSLKGKISLSRKALAKKIGALILERNSVNLHTDILDTPDFFWDNPEYEPLYHMTRADMSLENRTTVLNTRLDIVRELFDMIRDELNIIHTSMLEWVIIILIFIEVAMSLLIHVFKVF